MSKAIDYGLLQWINAKNQLEKVCPRLAGELDTALLLPVAHRAAVFSCAVRLLGKCREARRLQRFMARWQIAPAAA